MKIRIKNIRATLAILLVLTLICLILRACYYDDAPLVSASVNNDVDEINRLLAMGFDVNGRAVRRFNWTPLMAATFHRNTDAVATLLSNGADPNLVDGNGYTALFLSIDSRSMPQTNGIVWLLIKHGADLDQTNSLFHSSFRDWIKGKQEPLRKVVEDAEASRQGINRKR